MQPSLIKQRLRVPYYWLQVTTLGVFLITLILMLLTATKIKNDWITHWNMLIYPILIVQGAINVISYLDISARGLVMRRGWQRFEINWEQIESFGIGSIRKRQYLPYIILHQPIKGLPRVKLQELSVEQRQRTLTLEGWDNPEIIAKALHAILDSTSQQWQVAPDFSKSLKAFYYYQRLYLWTFLVCMLFFTYLLLK